MKKSIKIIPFPDIENAFIVISGHKDVKTVNGVRFCMSFVYGTDKGGAEWEPEFGPITKLIPCDEKDEEAQPHWFYPFYKGQGHWSQLKVDDEMLVDYFDRGDYKSIFNVLKKWSEN
jgi:hypothetical protein